MVFHGGNATTAYNLLMCSFLLNDFHIYAIDTIGHPGKSDEVCLPSKGYDYGKWASEVIDKIGYDRIAYFLPERFYPGQEELFQIVKQLN